MPATFSGYTYDHREKDDSVVAVEAATPAAATAAAPQMLVDIVDSLFGKSVIAVAPIAKGQHIFPFSGKVVSAPTMHTLQADEKCHVTCEGGPEFTSHSCEPNAFFQFGTENGTIQAVLVALRDIVVGEHISFNYNTTEWELAAPFSCLCGANNCIGQIRGFKYLTQAQRQPLMGQLSPFIAKRAHETQPCSPLIDVVETNAQGSTPALGRSIVAATDLAAGTVLFTLGGETRALADRHTVQVGENCHVLACGGAELTNHSCSPNAYFRVDVDATNNANTNGNNGGVVLQLVTLRALREREHITFHYCTTEWDMAEKFLCRCGADNCLGLVQGFAHLPADARASLEPLLTPYIRSRALACGLLSASGSNSPVLEPARPAAAVPAPAAAAAPAATDIMDPAMAATSLAAMAALAAANEVVRPINELVRIGANRYGRSLQANVELRAGQLIYSCFGSLQSTPDRFTVQLDEHSHLLVSGSAELTNHSCNPNGYFRVYPDHLELYALRDIPVGEDLTFHYCTTEWDMSEKFRCGCGAPQCVGWVQGYRHLTPEQCAHLPDFALSAFILRKRSQHRPINSSVDINEHSEVGRSLVAARELAPGAVLFQCSGPSTEMLNRPDRFTVQVDEQRHVNCHGSAELMNHSCDPNAYFIFHPPLDTLVCIARRTIHVGEPITFHYGSTEWEMAEPFRCQCGAGGDACLGQVRGFKYLNSRQRRALLDTPDLGLLPYLRERVARAMLIDVDTDELRMREREFAHVIGNARCTLTDTPYGRAVVAAHFLPAGTPVYQFVGDIFDHPTMHTVQLDDTRHINTHGGPEFTSHSCDPNSFFRFDGDEVVLVTRRDVLEGEQLTFHYCTTEWEMSEPFRCQCGSARCQGLVQGYRLLSHEQRAQLESMISPYIRSKRDEELGKQ